MRSTEITGVCHCLMSCNIVIKYRIMSGTITATKMLAGPRFQNTSTCAVLMVNVLCCIVLLFCEEFTYALSPSRISAFMSYLCTHHSSCEEPVSQKIHCGSLYTCTR